jgi:hypothetical protein
MTERAHAERGDDSPPMRHVHTPVFPLGTTEHTLISDVYQNVPWNSMRCKSRSGVWRTRHAFDRDARCIFCDGKKRG